jgi:hypothetical protein
MIRVRRTPTRFPWQRRYEIEARETVLLARGRAVRYLERLVGVGDAWAFLGAADVASASGQTGWAVEYDDEGGSS